MVMSVLMLPWLAHGHISPFLELSKRLSDKNIKIHFCSTAINLKSIKQNLLNTKYASSIHLVELTLPTNLLPPHYHTTKNLPPPLMPALKTAFDSAAQNFSDTLKLHSPDIVVYDFLQPWAPQVASSLGIPAVEFLCSSAAMAAFSTHAMMEPSGRFPFPEIYLNHHEAPAFARMLGSVASGVKDGDRVAECSERSVGVILVKSFREIEGKFIDFFSGLVKKKVVPTGALVEDPASVHGGAWDRVFEWLDRKGEKSTVFASFGSEYFLSKEEVTEMALGLELSKVNFIWVIRFHAEENNTSLKQILPEGYLERVGERGIVLEGWAPQAKILHHRSVGGFVSHCGWSSVMESMAARVPIIATPMHLDQPVNARLVAEEVGVGLEVKRDSQGRLRREAVAGAVRTVVAERGGETVRRKAMEVSAAMRNKREDEEMEVVVEELLQICRVRNFDQEEKNYRVLVPN